MLNFFGRKIIELLNIVQNLSICKELIVLISDKTFTSFFYYLCTNFISQTKFELIKWRVRVSESKGSFSINKEVMVIEKVKKF